MPSPIALIVVSVSRRSPSRLATCRRTRRCPTIHALPDRAREAEVLFDILRVGLPMASREARATHLPFPCSAASGSRTGTAPYRPSRDLACCDIGATSPALLRHSCRGRRCPRSHQQDQFLFGESAFAAAQRDRFRRRSAFPASRQRLRSGKRDA